MKKIIAEKKQEVEKEEVVEKKDKRKQSIKKRKSAKKQDTISRWSGAILLVIILFVGFLLWVSGEVGRGPGVESPRPSTDQTGSRVIIE